MMTIIMTQPKVLIKAIGILVYDGPNTLDAMGAYHTLAKIVGVKTMVCWQTKGHGKKSMWVANENSQFVCRS